MALWPSSGALPTAPGDSSGWWPIRRRVGAWSAAPLLDRGREESGIANLPSLRLLWDPWQKSGTTEEGTGFSLSILAGSEVVASLPKTPARLCQSGPRGAPAGVRPFFRASLPWWQERRWSPRPPAPASTRLSAGPPLGRRTRQSELDGAAAEPWRWSGVRMGRSHQSARAGTPVLPLRDRNI
jgi:hypothetical protein